MGGHAGGGHSGGGYSGGGHSGGGHCLAKIGEDCPNLDSFGRPPAETDSRHCRVG